MAASDYSLLPYTTAPPSGRSAMTTRKTLALTFACFCAVYTYTQWTLAPHSEAVHNYSRPPTLRLVTTPSNERLIKVSDEECGWNWWNQTTTRRSTQAPYGTLVPNGNLPYVVTDQNQFLLDDILRARVMTYPLLQSPDASEPPDFVWFPFLSNIHGENWFCGDKLAEVIAATVAEIRQLAATHSGSTYPKVVVPLGMFRLTQNGKLLTAALMEELSDRIVLIGFETSPLLVNEGLKYTIDIPYPTGFHFKQEVGVDWRETPGTDYFLNHERPYLVHFAGSASHAWDVQVGEKIKGFAVRRVLAQTMQDHELKVDSPTRTKFDNMVHYQEEGFLTRMYEHMTESVFSLEPAGDTPTRRGFYDVLLNGAIPVVFRNDTYDRLLPSSPEMDPWLFTVYMDEQEIIDGVGGSVIERLERIPKDEIRRKQEHIQRIARKLQYSRPTEDLGLPLDSPTKHTLVGASGEPFDFGEDAFSMILKELDTIRRGEWKRRRPERDLL